MREGGDFDFQIGAAVQRNMPTNSDLDSAAQCPSANFNPMSSVEANDLKRRQLVTFQI
jgi:hypothetical protein